MQDANHAGRAVACRKNLRLTEQEHSLTIWQVALRPCVRSSVLLLASGPDVYTMSVRFITRPTRQRD